MGTDAYDYTYDSIGNRLTASTPLTASAYNANAFNQYSSISNSTLPAPSAMLYDLDGNLTNDSVNVYAWNGKNRLTKVEPLSPTNGAFKCEFAYDYMGRRISKHVYEWDSSQSLWSKVKSHAFLYDGWSLIQELITQDSSLSTNSYIWGLDLSQTRQGVGGVGGLLAQITDNGSTVNCHYAVADANGNVTDYVSTNGTVIAHYEYSPFGKIDAMGLTGTEGGNEPPETVTGDADLSGEPTEVSAEGGLPYITPEISVEIEIANATDSAPITPPGGVNIGQRPYYDLDAGLPGTACYQAVSCSATCKDKCLTWITSWSTTASGKTTCSSYDSVNGTWSGCSCSANASATCVSEAASACGGE